jgi:hypothetical protein
MQAHRTSWLTTGTLAQASLHCQRICLGVGFARQSAGRANALPHDAYVGRGANAVNAAWAVVDPNPCIGKSELKLPARPCNAR